MKRLALFSLSILLSLTLQAQPQLIDKIIGVVGDKIVLHSEVQDQVGLIKSQQQGPVPEDLDCLVTDQLLTQRLLLVEAIKDSIVVSEDEVETQLNLRINQILDYMKGDTEQFEAYYGKSVQQVKEEFRRDLQDQLITQKIQGQIVEKVVITPAEVKRFFSRIPKDSLPYFNSEVEVGEIVIKPKINKGELEKAFTKLNDIRRRIIEDGENFAELAARYSDDPGSSRQGGSLGWVKRGVFVPEFEAALFRLSKNEYSPIIQTEFGYHLIQLIERRGNTVNARHILVKPEITEADLALASARLDTIRQLIVTDSISFTQAVKKYSEDEQSKNNAGLLVNPNTGNSIFEVSDLIPEIYFTIDTMDVEQISSPIRFEYLTSDPDYRLIHLRMRTDPHTASLQTDYAKIQQAAIEEKKVIHLNDWISNKVTKHYIYLDDQYRTCPALQKWNTNP